MTGISRPVRPKHSSVGEYPRRMTVAKPSALQETWCEAGGRRGRDLAGGEGAPLVLVHGLGGAASNWVELAPELARHRRVLVPELPGHGGSDPVPPGSTLAPFADTVAAVIEHEGVGPAPGAGALLGGVVALRLALQRRRAVSGLVIASGAGISSATAQARRALELVGAAKP